ncbi:MAG: DUF86 domain-containing protein [Candidatus Nitrosocaldaceae archaeon]|nr:MAG: DUF86 domain-containing protein [Candidatus Nitrosocaldaceae archaeon]GIU72549.1 MAG: DUF86 domain-containing protein [Candidatus Nitrosocaldaceae archaeon]
MRDSSLYIKDIIKAIDSIEEFIDNISFEEFKNDDLRASAVIRKLEIIGEATKKVPNDIKQRYNNIPWKEMAGMRDKLIHFYFGIKYELIWNAISILRDLKPILKKIANEQSKD